MDRIKIIVPKEGKKWKVLFVRDGKHGSPLSRQNATTVFSLIERRILASPRETKTHLYVDYRQTGGFHNDGVYSNPRELLYILGCFLEDYLSDKLQKRYMLAGELR